VPRNRRLIGLVVGDDPAVWTAAGFSVEDDHVDVGGVRVGLAGRAGGTGIRSWSFEPAWSQPIDGLATVHDPASGTWGAAPAAHPNGVTVLDHVVVATPDVERTTGALAAAGIEPLRTILGARGETDVLYRFFLLGTGVLELIGPAAAASMADHPAASPAGSPTVSTADEPARFVGLAFTTTTIDELGDIAGGPRPAIQPGRRIATLRREIGVSVPVAFLTPR
jgi:hypothetical protein